MKQCPECRRDCYDDTLLYWLDDGNALLARREYSSDGKQIAIVRGELTSNAVLIKGYR